MKNLFFVIALLLSVSASATCFQTCEDTDAGMDPLAFGVVTVHTSCAPPGGPVHTTTTHYFDSCARGLQVEYSCEGMTGLGIPKQRVYRCVSCDPRRQGVCVNPRAAGPVTDAMNQKYSCSTVTGGGPGPTPEPAPSDATESSCSSN